MSTSAGDRARRPFRTSLDISAINGSFSDFFLQEFVLCFCDQKAEKIIC